ncbi:MAG: ArsR family transcriptional regulator, arsenate/arsenite/antimonite-responsive transcriptional, partial [Actinomycetota bacterium]
MLRLVADATRWRLLAELGASDRRVGELVALLDEPQNLVSYHLRELRDAGLVSSRRSSFDKRDTYYRLDQNRCAEMFRVAGAALDPSLRVDSAAPVPVHAGRARPRVLFLCT